MKKGKWGFIKICSLIFFLSFILALVGCSSVSSQKNSTTDKNKITKVKNSSVKNKSDFVVSDLQQKPKLSATAISLYGSVHIPNSHADQLSESTKSSLKKGFSILIETESTKTSKYYTSKVAHSDYYKLQGSKYAEVIYYSAQNKKLLEVPLQKVVDYLNKTLTRAETNNIASRVSISMKQATQTAESASDNTSTQEWDGTTAVEFLKKVDASSPEGAKIVGVKYLIYEDQAVSGSDTTSADAIGIDKSAVMPADSWLVLGHNRSGAGARTLAVLTRNTDGTVTLLMCSGMELQPWLKATVQEKDYKVLSQEELTGQESLTKYFGGTDSSDSGNETETQDSNTEDNNQNDTDTNNYDVNN